MECLHESIRSQVYHVCSGKKGGARLTFQALAGSLMEVDAIISRYPGPER